MSSSTPGTSAKNKKKIEKTKEEDENQEGSRKIEFNKKENLPKYKSVDKTATSCTLKTVEDTYLWEAEDWDLGKLIRKQEGVSCESSSSSLGSVPSSSSSPGSALCAGREKLLPPVYSVSTLCAHYDQRCRTALYISVGEDDSTVVSARQGEGGKSGTDWTTAADRTSLGLTRLTCKDTIFLAIQMIVVI